VVLCYILPNLPARAALPDKVEQLRAKAEEAESRARWLDACALYDQLLKLNPTDAGIRARLHECLRHVHQLRRHRDPSFLKTILDLDPDPLKALSKALNIYEEVLVSVQRAYIDKEKVQFGRLFQQGVQELRFALEDETFQQEHLRGVSVEKLRQFASRLDPWIGLNVPTVKDARAEARTIALSAMELLDLNPCVTVLEFVCGACNGLDEYSFYLTPNQYQYLQACIKGEQVGVGLKVAWMDGKPLITAVLPNSPASEKGLKPGDRVIRIDGQSLDDLGAEHLAARLQGAAGSSVEVEVLSSLDMEARTVKMVRRVVRVPSVEWEAELRDGVGYVRITGFQETTPQELREAVISLQMAGLKALVLDLRGNGGGMLRAAEQVAELFLKEGTILILDIPIKGIKGPHPAKNPAAWTMPVVVLVDNETASAAEVVAGALKEHGRATLVGTPTFGKGSLQCPLELRLVPSGLWITVGKFYSPSNQPYSGRGVTPHLTVANDGTDIQRTEAWRAAISLTMMPPR